MLFQFIVAQKNNQLSYTYFLFRNILYCYDTLSEISNSNFESPSRMSGTVMNVSIYFAIRTVFLRH